MTKATTYFSVHMDTGDDSTELESFDTRKEAIDSILKEIEEWKNGTGWNWCRENNPHMESLQLEVIQHDNEDSSIYEPLDCWDSKDGWMDIDEPNTGNSK
jgi:hypothetical protein